LPPIAWADRALVVLRCLGRHAQLAPKRVGRSRTRFGLAVIAAIVTALSFVAVPALVDESADARPRAKHAAQKHVKKRLKNIPLPVRAPPAATTGSSEHEATAAPQSPSSHASTQSKSASEGPARQSPAPAVPLPLQPVAISDERISTVLEKHCARCHQAGALQGRSAPDGGIANILALDEISRNPSLVRAGEPDASPLYQLMIGQQMPSDVLRHGSPGVAPDAAEIRAVRAWIKSLAGQSTGEQCPDRTPITHEVMNETVSQWLDVIGPDRAAGTRFISLAHFYNACSSDAELAAMRKAVALTLNQLSWSHEPAAVDTVGESLAVLAIRLSDLGWSDDHWKALVEALPSAARFKLPEPTRTQAHTEVPLLNGDWLAHRALQPDLYMRLLGLPPTLDDLARILRINLDNTRQARFVRRSIVSDSAITGGPRIIERYKTPQGYLWLAHDYEPTDETPLLDQPLLPWAANSGGEQGNKLARYLGARALFALPNGMTAFMLFDENGSARQSSVLPPASAAHPEHPPESEKNTTARSESAAAEAAEAKDPSKSPADAPAAAPKNRHNAAAFPKVELGRQCISCHATGPQPYHDSLAEHLESDAYRGNPVSRDIAKEMTVSRGELQSYLADDALSVRRAMTTMATDPSARLYGFDLVSGLASLYTRDLDVTAAAAELLIPGSDLLGSLSRLSREALPVAELATRLALGRLPRDAFETLRPYLTMTPSQANTVASLSQSASTAPGTSASTPDGPADARTMDTAHIERQALQLWPDKISYARNDRIVLNVRSGHTCHLTLINVDQTGKATVLFPNEFARDNLIKAGKLKRLPAADALYFFRMQQPGTEKFVAICEDDQPVPAGIKPNLVHMNFTALGDWVSFLDDSVKAASAPRVPLTNGDDIDRRRRGGKESLPPAPVRAPFQSRAAVTITVLP
jgi:hypothetical protein